MVNNTSFRIFMRLVFSSLFLQLHILTAKVQKNAKNCLFSAIFLGLFSNLAVLFAPKGNLIPYVACRLLVELQAFNGVPAAVGSGLHLQNTKRLQ